MKDQRGAVHTYTYDSVGRFSADTITTLPGGVDGSILRMNCIPLQHRFRCLECFTRRDLFGCVPVPGVDPYVTLQNI